MSKRPSKKALDALRGLYMPLTHVVPEGCGCGACRPQGRPFIKEPPRNTELEAKLSIIGIPEIT